MVLYMSLQSFDSPKTRVAITGVCVFVCIPPETCVFNDSPVASVLIVVYAGSLPLSALLQALSRLFFLFWAVLV